MVKIIEVHVPEYGIKEKPDYVEAGKKVDKEIEKNLPDGQYVYRAIGSDDHPGVSIEKPASIVIKLGTDKYDPDRKEVCHEEFCTYDHDFHAGSFEIQDHKMVLDDSYELTSMFGDTIKKFYENVLLDRGCRLRIDLLIIYCADKLERAKKVDPDAENARPELEECLYKFKDPKNNKDALLCIVKN